MEVWEGRDRSLGVIIAVFFVVIMELDMNGVGGRRGGEEGAIWKWKRVGVVPVV